MNALKKQLTGIGKKTHFIHKARPTWNRLGAFFGQHPSQASQGETLLTSRNQEAQQEWFTFFFLCEYCDMGNNTFGFNDLT